MGSDKTRHGPGRSDAAVGSGEVRKLWVLVGE
jgi:hypothetical protein